MTVPACAFERSMQAMFGLMTLCRGVPMMDVCPAPSVLLMSLTERPSSPPVRSLNASSLSNAAINKSQAWENLDGVELYPCL